MEPCKSNPSAIWGLSQLFRECGMSTAQAAKVKNYINRNSPNWDKALVDRYLRKRDTNLPVTLQYSSMNKKTFVHFKRRTKDPKYIGTGHYKNVVFTLDVTTMSLSVKSISKLISPAYREVASREYRALVSLQGIPGVPVLQGGMTYLGKDGTQRFSLITPYCEGKDLYSALYETETPAFPLSQSEKFWILWDVINTTAQVHQRGICHRDLKVENIFLTWNYEQNRWGAVVGDFGGAASIQHIVHTSPDGVQSIASTDKYDSWAIGMLCNHLFPLELQSDPELKSIYNWLIWADPAQRCNVIDIIPYFQQWGFKYFSTTQFDF